MAKPRVRAKFNYAEFSDNKGEQTDFVLHAHKYTKEEALDIFCKEYEDKGYICTIDDIQSGYAKYFSKYPGFEETTPGPCYAYIDAPQNASFPIWIIPMWELKKK